MLKLRRHLLPQIRQMHTTGMGLETCPGSTVMPLDADTLSVESEIILHTQVVLKMTGSTSIV